MADHDLQCSWCGVTDDEPGDWCDCPLIGRVRAEVIPQVRAGTAERIAQAIEAWRDENWALYLTTRHPLSDVASCPVDYAIRDTFDVAAGIAREVGAV